MTISKKKAISRLFNQYDSHDQRIKNLSQFAFIAIQQDHLIFTMDEILELYEKYFQFYWYGLDFLNVLLKLGLLSTALFQVENTHYKAFYFNNLRILKYLAAYYIYSLPDRELQKLLYSKFWTVDYLNIWISYIDIGGGKNFVFEEFLSNIKLSRMAIMPIGKKLGTMIMIC